MILRRPPRPPLPPSAHDVLREARLLRALAPTAARVPEVLAVGDDESVIGSPFYIMERVEGEVVTSAVPAAFDTPEQRRRMGEELIDALVEVHAVKWEDCGLEGYGKPTGYLERQLRRFNGLWEHNRTREVPAVERVGAWLAEHLPESGPATIVHGDYRLGNTMFGAEPPARLVAIFDWEMATIGDPLADVGYMCVLWSEASDPAGGLFDLSAVTRAEGFPTRAPSWWRAMSRAAGARCATRAGTWCSRCGSRSCSWRATTSAPSPARPTTRSSSSSARA